MARKQREAPPPSMWIRSIPSGVPAKLCRTRSINDADEWLYRMDYGSARGTQLWSVSDLERHPVEWLDEQPADWQMAEYRMRRPEGEES